MEDFWIYSVLMFISLLAGCSAGILCSRNDDWKGKVILFGAQLGLNATIIIYGHYYPEEWNDNIILAPLYSIMVLFLSCFMFFQGEKIAAGEYARRL